jgi:site-specific DNA-methyltransferase (adenine-specific)
MRIASFPEIRATNRSAVRSLADKQSQPSHACRAQVLEKCTAPGRTLLHHGDCLVQLPLIAERSVDLVVTDLPYGTTACPWDSIIPLDQMWQELKRVGTPDCVFVFTAQQPFTWALCASNPGDFCYELIWEKPNGTNPFQAKVMPMKRHENILVFARGHGVYHPQMIEGKPYRWNSRRSGGEAGGIAQQGATPIDNKGTRYPSSVLRFGQERGLHPTQKPVALMEWLIRTYSDPGACVLDITMGSGTTGVAAMNTQRHFIGMELDSRYFAIAEERIRAAERLAVTSAGEEVRHG